MQPPEETASSTPRVERPDLRVLDNQGQPVGGEAGPGPHLAESRPPSAAVDARHVQGKVCYGILLFSNAHALSGRDPVRCASGTENGGVCRGVPPRRVLALCQRDSERAPGWSGRGRRRVWASLCGDPCLRRRPAARA